MAYTPIDDQRTLIFIRPYHRPKPWQPWWRLIWAVALWMVYLISKYEDAPMVEGATPTESSLKSSEKLLSSDLRIVAHRKLRAEAIAAATARGTRHRLRVVSR